MPITGSPFAVSGIIFRLLRRDLAGLVYRPIVRNLRVVYVSLVQVINQLINDITHIPQNCNTQMVPPGSFDCPLWRRAKAKALPRQVIPYRATAMPRNRQLTIESASETTDISM